MTAVENHYCVDNDYDIDVDEQNNFMQCIHNLKWYFHFTLISDLSRLLHKQSSSNIVKQFTRNFKQTLIHV